MNKQAPQMNHDGNPDYVIHNPDAIQNPDKALEMAYASKHDEELANLQANFATEYVERANRSIHQIDRDEDMVSYLPKYRLDARFNPDMTDPTRPISGDISEEDADYLRKRFMKNAEYNIAMSEKARLAADSRADAAGLAYDIGQKVEQIKSGRATERVSDARKRAQDDLDSGVAINYR